MADNTLIERLNEIRFAALRQASESRDVEALMSWHSKDATFVGKGQNICLKGRDAVREFYAMTYKSMPAFRITESKFTAHTLEFVACEMKCDGQAGIDLPGLGAKAGETVTLTGVSLFWCRWEGDGEWDGNLSEEVVKGWKIIEEHAYYHVEVSGREPGNKDHTSSKGGIVDADRL
ncbi:hypothetical protein F5Y19DRAFT_458915 [Xylariaceae sp. FL1651]|nr:hypothetical protein F5Y19DRAFT_458915 [Xylariaceae sp. FL1651]